MENASLLLQTNPEPPAPVAASFTACFLAEETIAFAISSLDSRPNHVGSRLSLVGPRVYQGREGMGQTFFYRRKDGFAWTWTQYWTVTDSGVTFIGAEDSRGQTTTFSAVPLPPDMRPGQTVGLTTFVGFETFSMTGKTFHNTCHLRIIKDRIINDIWYAPGYGLVREFFPNFNLLYNGGI